MLSSDEGDGDVFFDSVDCLSNEESVVAKEGAGCLKLGYEIWMDEPQSIKQRRRRFFHGMGLDEFVPENEVCLDSSSQILGVERIIQSSDAVMSSSVSHGDVSEVDFVCCERERTCETNSMADEWEQDQKAVIQGEYNGLSPTEEFEQREAQVHLEDDKNANVNKKKLKKLWKHIVKMRRRHNRCAPEVSKPYIEVPVINGIKVKPNKKQYMEFTALYMEQEIQAHKGFIWTMNFSPDGQYLATGGEDGVVRIWQVTSTDASCEPFMTGSNIYSKMKERKSGFVGKMSSQAPVIIPKYNFQIEESPLQEFHGHSSDVLDLAWSSSNFLLSSSMDKTVRLWQVGCDHCLNQFHHNNYVTCIQFNPNDENFFISGCIDGKVRIWGVSEKRVVDWADMRDVITAICYQNNGKGFIVGTITGRCRFYEALGDDVKLTAEIHIQGRKKASGNRITGIQCCQDESQRFMITSEDSKVRIFDGLDVVHEFRGVPKSGSQISASFTSTGRHIISVGEDCHVYVWNYNNFGIQSQKHKKSVSSCERFFCEDVSVAVPWSGPGLGQMHVGVGPHCCSTGHDHLEGASRIRESGQFCLGNWLSMDVPSFRGSSATWPEEKLHLWDVTFGEDEVYASRTADHKQQQHHCWRTSNSMVPSETWGLVIVAAGWDGRIKTFRNHGMPVRL
ncbi:hypothetical protein SLE2022_291910 [Rubroshorea leprosula]